MVRAVIADTGPVHYLVLIGHIEILPALFEKVIIPSVVRSELARIEAPEAVRNWITEAPAWLQVHTPTGEPFDEPSLKGLDDGEKAALVLAASLAADLVLMDDRDGVRVGQSKGFRVIGTLGVLDLGARLGRPPRPPRHRCCIRADQAHEFPLPPGDHGRVARSREGRINGSRRLGHPERLLHGHRRRRRFMNSPERFETRSPTSSCEHWLFVHRSAGYPA